MRTQLENIERAEQYLNNGMTAPERQAFETELTTDATLRDTVAQVKALRSAVIRKELRSRIESHAGGGKGWSKGGLNWGLGGLVILMVAAAAWFLTTQFLSETSENLRYGTNELGTTEFADADRFLPSQVFDVDGGKDTVIQTKGGITMTILANTFLDEDDKPVQGRVELEVKEAIDPLSIMKAGLTTMSGDQLLESGGMFYVNGRQGKKSLQINPDQGIYTQVPTDNKVAKMQLFDGKRMADGRIDWVNPKPLETFLTPVEITTLNFYPPDYLDELENRGRDRSDKPFTDSLYYSYASDIQGVDKGRSSVTYKSELGEVTVITWEAQLLIDPSYSGKALLVLNASIKDGWILNGFKQSELPPLRITFRESDTYELVGALQVDKGGPMNMTGYGIDGFDMWASFSQMIEMKNMFCSVEIEAEYTVRTNDFVLPPESGQLVVQHPLCENLKEQSGINPASIKTIWNEKFNNTNLATKEFEERLAHIHNTCDQWILDYYVNNLDKRISTLDSAVAQRRSATIGVEYVLRDTIGGAIYPTPEEDKFWEFARRGDGRVESNNQYAEFLKGYYHRQAEMEVEAIKLARKKYDEENRKKWEEAQKKSQEHATKEMERYNENWAQEFTVNVKEAYRQLGYPEPTVQRGRVTNNAVVRSSGWKNVDQYVAESVTKRETLDYTDKDGNRAVIRYEAISLQIANAEEFDRVLVYMLPDNLYNFQRMNQNGKAYSEKLNELFEYDVMCIGFKGDESFIHHIRNAEAKDHGTVTLSHIASTELEKLLYTVKDYSIQSNLKEDLAYQRFETKERKRVEKLMAREKLRAEMHAFVFPCRPHMYEGDYTEWEMVGKTDPGR